MQEVTKHKGYSIRVTSGGMFVAYEDDEIAAEAMTLEEVKTKIDRATAKRTVEAIDLPVIVVGQGDGEPRFIDATLVGINRRDRSAKFSPLEVRKAVIPLVIYAIVPAIDSCRKIAEEFCRAKAAFDAAERALERVDLKEALESGYGRIDIDEARERLEHVVALSHGIRSDMEGGAK